MNTTLLISLLTFSALAASAQSAAVRNPGPSVYGVTQARPTFTPTQNNANSTGASYVQVNLAPSSAAANATAQANGQANGRRRGGRQGRGNGNGAEYLGVSLAPRR